MKLLVTTPTEVVVKVDDIRHIRAEDDTGAFGILPGHTDFVTVLPISVLSWDSSEGEGFALVRRGVMVVSGGRMVEVAARSAWREGDLSALGATVLGQLEKADELEEAVRTGEARLHIATMRQLEKVLRAGHKRAGSILASLAPTRPAAP